MSHFRILMISFWTPTQQRPQAYLAGKLIRAFVDSGIELTVATLNSEVVVPVNVKTVCLKQKTQGLGQKLYENATGRFSRGYYAEWVEECVREIEKNRIQCVFSFANPQESNILAGMIRERVGVPVIIHFSDPYYGNPMKGRFTGRRWLLKNNQRYILQNSDATVFVNENLKRLVAGQSRFGEKGVVIPHAYDPALYLPLRERVAEDPFRIGHIGAFYKNRTPEPLFQGLSRLLSICGEQRNRLRLELVGPCSNYAGFTEEDLASMIEKYDLGKFIDVLDTVDYEESLRRMSGYDLLVAIDPPIENSPFLPSKLIDYAGSGVRIVGITSEGSPTQQVLTNLGCEWFRHREAEELAVYLLSLLREDLIPSTYDAGMYSIDSVCRMYRDLLKRTMNHEL